jgi:hypothetical protein
MCLGIGISGEFRQHSSEISESIMPLAPTAFSRTTLQAVSRMLETTNVIKNYDYVQIQLLYPVNKHLYNVLFKYCDIKMPKSGKS